jgi:hypothetical protein
MSMRGCSETNLRSRTWNEPDSDGGSDPGACGPDHHGTTSIRMVLLSSQPWKQSSPYWL